MLRKTRFVCVSDTHGYTPSEAGFKLPTGDVLIHAGDLTNHGSASELRRTIDWISQADFEIKIIVAGNHDVTIDPEFYAKHGQGSHGQRLEDPRRCMDIVTGAGPSVVLLHHQPATIHLARADGPNTAFKVFGSPYSPGQGDWAFGYESSAAAALWDQIPSDTDILVTHTPPQSHCDQKPGGTAVGCDTLRQALSRIRPLLAVCGHVHEGRGYERVRWGPADIGAGREADGVEAVFRGSLPTAGSRKQSLVDLTGKRAERLENEGFACSNLGSGLGDEAREMSSASRGSAAGAVPGAGGQTDSSSAGAGGDSYVGCNPPLGADRPGASGHHGLQPLRRETCIVNAAIMATSWPHQGGKRFNAPIVVDVELPVWQA
ncbi:hypothetical protein N7462_007246 [Penicillium macrosclerotiorum]|uniref:uncharacterized protein n=1 Tax=Penicillium macrosclerotiorum TaxID=303699 RepID=UPI002547FCAC|nr:uncharacterized protein N7462_007246 [Penicillium macrosclerotiorum]KAJ5679002.1 hypothetical protein N7462_007246 [Penicillium macrosclerotiorum]